MKMTCLHGIDRCLFNRMTRRVRLTPLILFSVGLVGSVSSPAGDYQVKSGHPRLLSEDVAAMTQRCAGPLADDYRVVKERADAAVKRGGIEFISNPWAIPEDLMNCGLTY